VLVGFPGETEADHSALLEFLEELQFDRVGAFAYSEQEGTRAAALPDDVPNGLKQERLSEVMELQRAISAERLERLVGREVEVLVDGPAHGDDPGVAVGRTIWQADDVDGCTHLAGRAAPAAGSFVKAKVIETLDYDLVAESVA